MLVGRQETEWAGWRRGNLPGTTTMAALLPTALSLTSFILPSYSLLHIPAQDSTVVAPQANAPHTLKNPLGGKHQAQFLSKSSCCSVKDSLRRCASHISSSPRHLGRVESGAMVLDSVQLLALNTLRFRQLGSKQNFTLAEYRLATIPPSHLAAGAQRESDADNGHKNSQ